MFEGFELIDGYSRSEAIEDGKLVDVTSAARETGIKYPCALTRAAWETAVAWTSEDNERKGALQDERGRLHDVLWMFFLAARRSKGSEFVYSIVAVPREGSARKAQPLELKAVCGPGDTPEPVITISLPGED